MTVISNVLIFSLIATPHCSHTSGEVVGCNFSYNSKIFIWKLNVTLTISSFDAQTTTADIPTLSIVVASSEMFNSGTILHATQLSSPGFEFALAVPPFLSALEISL